MKRVYRKGIEYRYGITSYGTSVYFLLLLRIRLKYRSNRTDTYVRLYQPSIRYWSGYLPKNFVRVLLESDPSIKPSYTPVGGTYLSFHRILISSIRKFPLPFPGRIIFYLCFFIYFYFDWHIVRHSWINMSLFLINSFEICIIELDISNIYVRFLFLFIFR